MITSSPDLWIGLDLGTSGLKGVAVNAEGLVVARAGAAYPTHRPAPGAAEQHPADWLAAIAAVAARLARHAPPSRWRGIGLAAMMPTLVLVQAGGEPVGAAVTWQDGRAEPHGDRLRGVIGGDELYRATGQWVDGRYLLPMYLRLASADPDVAAAASLLSAKDFVFRWLTGTPLTDPSTAAGFGCYQLGDRDGDEGGWDDRVLAAARSVLRQGPDGALPGLPAVAPASTTRPLLPGPAGLLGCGQIPVCLGAADSVLGALGLGAAEPGQLAYIAGTSTVILGVTATPRFDPAHRYLVTPLAEAGRWGLEMDLLATGSALRWLAGLLGDGLDEAGILAMAAAVAADGAPDVLPYLSPGEQGALWDPALRGVIAGLTLGHGRAHLARGLVNGIVLESRRCLDVLDEAAGFGPELLVAGGSAAAAAFRADLADAVARRVVAPGRAGADVSAVGAALLARQAAGGPPVPRRQPGGTPDGDATDQVAVPDPGRTAVWDQLWIRYERTRLGPAAGARVPG